MVVTAAGRNDGGASEEGEMRGTRAAVDDEDVDEEED